MSEREKMLDALVWLNTAETEEERDQAISELRNLLGDAPDAETKPPLLDIEDEIHLLFRELGVPLHIKGYARLVYAVRMVIKDHDLVERITKGLYPMVAEKFADTPSRVERSMRHAIEVCWGRADLEVLDKYFGNTVSLSKGKPTNGEFIANVANIIRMRMKENAA